MATKNRTHRKPRIELRHDPRRLQELFQDPEIDEILRDENRNRHSRLADFSGLDVPTVDIDAMVRATEELLERLD